AALSSRCQHVESDIAYCRMDNHKRKRLESSGWNLGSFKEFLGLSDEEHALVDLKLGLANVKEGKRIASRRSLGFGSLRSG
ncbi:MAG TPA: hypothetical protein VN867_09205, partial [Candidatus Binataceae bacterium]|nr:hypothetical protein [Candidatus Binataceae bacterium]